MSDIRDTILAVVKSHHCKWQEGRGLVCTCGVPITFWSVHLTDVIISYVEQYGESRYRDGYWDGRDECYDAG